MNWKKERKTRNQKSKATNIIRIRRRTTPKWLVCNKRFKNNNNNIVMNCDLSNVDPTGRLAMVGSIRQVDLTETMRVTRHSAGSTRCNAATVAQNDGRWTTHISTRRSATSWIRTRSWILGWKQAYSVRLVHGHHQFSWVRCAHSICFFVLFLLRKKIVVGPGSRKKGLNIWWDFFF